MPVAAGNDGANNNNVAAGVQAAPSMIQTILNAVMMYLVISTVIGQFLPQSKEPAKAKRQREVNGDGEVVTAKLPPYPAWRRGTVGAMTFAFTLGNETDAPVLPMGDVKYASTVDRFANPRRCPVTAKYSMTPGADGTPNQRLTSEWRPLSKRGEFGPVLVNYTDAAKDVFGPVELNDVYSEQSVDSPRAFDFTRQLASCRTESITFNFTGLNFTEAVVQNVTVYLRVTLSPVSEILPSTTRYFQLSQFRHRPPPKPKKNLLQNAAAQSPRYMLDAKPEANATNATDAESEEASSTDDSATVGKTRVYMPPEMPIVIAPAFLPVDQLPPVILDKFDRSEDGVLPLIHHHDFWIVKSRLMEVNTTTATTVGENFTVSVSALDFTWALMYVMYEQQYQSQVAMGLATPDDGDALRSILLDNSPWYLALCIGVSLLRMVFETLAFKNDVQFWKGKKDLRGLSLRTVAINCYFQTVIFLYLLDDGNTSWAVTLPMAVGVAIEFWKLFQCVKLRRDPATNKIVGFDWNWQEEDETSEHDRQAMRYMMIIGAPCLALYTGYSLMYEEHSGWYSFAIRTQVRFIYYAGFAMMCPQIFINYKLKSVAAMPWKSFVYKALNTVVDDLFAFVIAMPLLHRLACFRDDVVFLILLYQRWIYRVDPTRVNEFGQRGDGKAPDAPTDAKKPAGQLTNGPTPSPSRATSEAPTQATTRAPSEAPAAPTQELRQRRKPAGESVARESEAAEDAAPVETVPTEAADADTGKEKAE
eukprot:CAMPEP_0174835384 /NCGR_PEP_ID=MMETSP1114-20130205/5378_1 /TAXON_ID=312471 /ORGANISM="Neobodo designis, Strain CCAP 1951/1" /LENGTH=758 /DNA_ID=CAMNT_0016069331 /DNA_START=34 /DNA_END=2310 /DNA_ORIENTATION=-